MLQTYHGENALIYEKRDPWEPDYHLAFYGSRVVKVEGELVDLAQVQGEDIPLPFADLFRRMSEQKMIEGVMRVEKIEFLPMSSIPTHNSFTLKIRNVGTSDISDIGLNMVGAVGAAGGLVTDSAAEKLRIDNSLSCQFWCRIRSRPATATT